ncbi:hypothetical protein [Massilia sp. PWRC2]|uniref:hypothetical protein n=1 Tax=Massilia sp. PWRC2 TaxID=2804626 RepID=UPI003CF61472
MRLPGTRYQEHGWELVRKLLGQCSLQACAAGLPARIVNVNVNNSASAALADCLDDYIERCSGALRASARQPRAAADGNSYGESVLELALALLCELQARPADWHALAAALGADAARLGHFWQQPGGEAMLRKKFNDMYALLRDKVDCDNYIVACGRPCSANRMYAYRMLDTAYADIARLFDSWREAPEQVAAILGRAVDAAAAPIEVRQMKSIGDCQAAWLIAWSASRERFTGAAGPLHTHSKRFANLKNSPDKIAAMLAEIGDYEQLSANGDGPWQQDAADASAWLDDLARVLDDAVDDDGDGGRVLARPAAAAAADADADADGADHSAARSALSAPPSYVSVALLAGDAALWAARAMAGCSLPVQLAVYLKLVGARDDCYRAEWLDGVSGELPTMAQLAALDGVSLPTLRKRRDSAIAALQAGTQAGPRPGGGTDEPIRRAQ